MLVVRSGSPAKRAVKRWLPTASPSSRTGAGSFSAGVAELPALRRLAVPLAAERLHWPAAKSPEETARREQLIEKYGWKGVSTRIRTQNHQSSETINNYDRIDSHYLGLWFDFIYGELYPRGIIDDRTRLLMMVGICLALNEPVQLENHIRGAMLLGATPREVLEVIVNSTAYVGMPTTVQVVRVLDRVAKEEGRSAELAQAS